MFVIVEAIDDDKETINVMLRRMNNTVMPWKLTE
jgi:hypothetical protein